MIGTPARTSDASVRAKRAMAVLRMSGPKMGSAQLEAGRTAAGRRAWPASGGKHDDADDDEQDDQPPQPGEQVRTR